MVERHSGLDGLRAELAAACAKWNVAQALRAGFGRAWGWATEAEQKGVDGQDDEEVDHRSVDQKRDHGIEKSPYLNTPP